MTAFNKNNTFTKLHLILNVFPFSQDSKLIVQLEKQLCCQLCGWFPCYFMKIKIIEGLSLIPSFEFSFSSNMSFKELVMQVNNATNRLKKQHRPNKELAKNDVIFLRRNTLASTASPKGLADRGRQLKWMIIKLFPWRRNTPSQNLKKGCALLSKSSIRRRCKPLVKLMDRKFRPCILLESLLSSQTIFVRQAKPRLPCDGIKDKENILGK